MVEPLVSKDVILQNALGLHARAAAAFVKCASGFSCEITVSKKKVEVNGKSIMGLMMLAMPKGTNFTITASGTDAQIALESLAKLVDGKFGES